MDENVLIQVKHESMCFHLASERFDGFKEYLIQRMKKKITYQEFWALSDVSFEVERGETLGLIGVNGSGKSTMLKIIAGVMKPTKGSVKVSGVVAPLIELGAGFDFELTARENVFLNGTILGYTREYMKQHYDDIVEFSELGTFMDVPVKNFSSGMVSRLGFSIATVAGAAEILILDEVLSVGDEFFRKKSLARIKELIHGGSTVLMVSHGMQTILDNCTKVVWIEQGNMRMIGEPKTVCKAYRSQYSE